MRRSRLHSEAEFRETYSDRSWERYRPLVAMIVEFAPPGPVLDVGAGTGLLAECCTRFGMRCIGYEGAIAGAREGVRRGVPMLTGRLEEGLPFADGSFATVMCNQVIEHLYPETAELFLAEAYRVLEPGGVLFVQSPSIRDPVQRAEEGHINLYLPSGLARDVRAAGFEIVATRNGPRDFLGGGRRVRQLTLGVMRLTGADDLLSGSANVIARRPR